MKKFSTEKLLKILQLSTTDNDKEALVCIRTANKILKENNIQWKDLIHDGSNTKDYFQQKDKKFNFNKDEILSMLEELLYDCDDLSDSQNNLIDSMHSFLITHNYLTEKQVNTIRNIYERYF